jgi:hypothetical protein
MPAVTEILAAPETLAAAALATKPDTSRAHGATLHGAAPTAAAITGFPAGAAAPPPVTGPPAGATLPAATETVSRELSADSIVVEVSVTPAADIALDGVNVAAGVSRWAKRLVRKRWTVSVDGGEYGKREQKKKPRAEDAVLSFAFDLLAGEGGVQVNGPRGGLDIYIDGVYQHAVTPSPVRPVKVGPHTVEVRDRRTGQVVASRQVVIKQGANNLMVDLSSGR